jgi:hypothetical protein
MVSSSSDSQDRSGKWMLDRTEPATSVYSVRRIWDLALSRELVQRWIRYAIPMGAPHVQVDSAVPKTAGGDLELLIPPPILMAGATVGMFERSHHDNQES